MMEIWRVQHPFGHGPFLYNFYSNDEVELLKNRFDRDPGKFPTTVAEGIYRPGHRTGCVSLTQLRHWFGCRRLVALFEAKGLELVRLLVPEHAVRVGRRQCVYDPAVATLVGAWPMSNILKPKHAWVAL